MLGCRWLVDGKVILWTAEGEYTWDDFGAVVGQFLEMVNSATGPLVTITDHSRALPPAGYTERFSSIVWDAKVISSILISNPVLSALILHAELNGTQMPFAQVDTMAAAQTEVLRAFQNYHSEAATH